MQTHYSKLPYLTSFAAIQRLVLRDFQQIAVLPVVVRQHDLADGAALRILI